MGLEPLMVRPLPLDAMTETLSAPAPSAPASPRAPDRKPGSPFVTRLVDLPLQTDACVRRVGGDRSFRRRLMELGLVPGTTVRIRNVAPMGDPLELELRGCRLSIRRAEASEIEVDP